MTLLSQHMLQLHAHWLLGYLDVFRLFAETTTL